MNDRTRDLYEELKYRFGFPPRATAAPLKASNIARGLGLSGGLVGRIANVYAENVEQILDEFVVRAASRPTTLGFKNFEEVREAVSDAHQQLFLDAGKALAEEFPSQEFQAPAIAELDAQRGRILEHLNRDLRIRWRDSEVEKVVPEKEREQKFKILLSAGQAKIDFEAFAADATRSGNSVGILFIDIDYFKELNKRWNETIVDQSILPEAQKLLAKLVQGRGEAYRYGGEEFVIIVPNLDAREAKAFAEKVRDTFERQSFSIRGQTQKITLSIGVALWPENGATYDQVVQAANDAEAKAKQARNAVKVAGEH